MKTPLSHIELSKENLLHNVATFRALLGEKKKLVAVVKANAYGHGMKEIVKMLDGHVDYFQVDDIEELRELRKITNTPTFVLGYVLKDDLEELVQLSGTVTIFDWERMETVNEIGRKNNQKITVHLEVDALLGRLGLLPDDVEKFFLKAKELQYVSIEALYAHFSDIEDSENLVNAHKQQTSIKAIAEKLNLPFHISATAGILSDHLHNWDGYISRLGIGLYGLWPSKRLQDEWQGKVELKPVLSWKTKIAQIKKLPSNYPIGYGCSFVTVRETTIAVIPQGYSDGYDRKLSNNSFALINGIRCTVLGRIAMNMFVVDVSEAGEIFTEQEVVLIGKQGIEEITAEEFAERIGTINYEIVARISAFLKKIIT
jgi:alanine racemase